MTPGVNDSTMARIELKVAEAKRAIDEAREYHLPHYDLTTVKATGP